MRALCRGLMPMLMLIGVACSPAASPSAGPAAAKPVAPASGNAPPAAQAPAPAAQSSSQPTGQPEWQAEWDRTVAAARQEGKVVVLGPPGDGVRRTLGEAWRQAFPNITLEWSGGRGGEQATKLEAERRGGIYAADIMISGTTTSNTQMKPIGALDPIKPVLMLPEVTDPRNWLGNRLEFSDKDELNLVFITIPNSLIAFNLSQVNRDEIDEPHELLDPKWRGKIVVNDPIPSGSGNVVHRFFWHALGPEKGEEFIRGLRTQAAVVDRDQRRQVEWVARARYPIAVAPSDGVATPLREEGLQFGLLGGLKDHGTATTASFGSLMLLNRAPHPNAAKVFVNWLLTKEGQTAYSIGMEQPSRRLDVPTDHLDPDTLLRPDGKYWPSYYEDNVAMPPALGELLREVYGR
jgi:iron(III) transport system substrate-binding protein